MKRRKFLTKAYPLLIAAGAAMLMTPGCKRGTTKTAAMGDGASKAFVPPGQYDEFYNFVSGGFNGQMSVYGIPSGRLLKNIPVFSQNPENGWGYSEETKPMLMTTHGFIPWDDTHHVEPSMTNGRADGRWMFLNGNNTPRVAVIDLTTFSTKTIIEIPNSAGNHSSPFTTPNSEYVVAGTRFSIPMGDATQRDIPINEQTRKNDFLGNISFLKPDLETGNMAISFQIQTPGIDFDLAHAGKGPSDGWMFFSCYNTEKAHTLQEVNASQNDKDFVMAVNWKKAEQYFKDGKGKMIPGKHYVNHYDDATHMASSKVVEEVFQLDPGLDDILYFMPCGKSPHGCDVDPTGRFIVASGKLAAKLPVFSFEKMIKAIADKDYEGEYDGIPVLNYESVLHGEVERPGLGPLHTEFDNKGFAYSSMFVSSEIVKWNVESLEIVDRVPTYYSIGHLGIPGGDSNEPWGKYMVAYNKITKDRFLPTGPELAQSAQLYSIDGPKIELLADYPSFGEPHYAQFIPADMIRDKSVKFFDINKNEHPYVTKGEREARVVRDGNKVHVYMTMIRSHFAPDNIEGIKMGDEVYFHVTNLEQDWDVPHGFAVMGNNNAELLVVPGETQTLKWEPTKVGVWPFYCTDFCSALHQEMMGYVRVSPAGSNVPLTANTRSADAGL